jgi:hypothetical protein
MPATGENILFSCLLSKYTDIKIYRTVILPVVLYECDTSSYYRKYSNRICLRTQTDSVWTCLRTQTVSEYAWQRRLNLSEETDWQCLNMSENTDLQFLNMSEDTDIVWICLRTQTVCDYVWEHRLAVSEHVWGHRLTVPEYVWEHRRAVSEFVLEHWQCLNMPENTDWQCLNISEDTDWQSLNMSENKDWQCLNMSDDTNWQPLRTGSWWDSLGLKAYLHNRCTWQMCNWFVIAHRAKSLLFCCIGLFGRHLLWHMLVKCLSGRYHIPTSCLLGCYPSYQITLIVHISHLFCLSSITESWKCNSKFWRDK